MTRASTTALPEAVPLDTAPPACPLPIRAELPGVPASVPAARRLVRDALADCPRADDLAQAVTELASNAVIHSAARDGGTFTVTVRTALRWARIEVTDPGPAHGPAQHGNGWGLGIVAALTDRHGTRYDPDTARTAWAEASWPPSITQPG